MLTKTEKRGEEKDLETHGRAWFRNSTSATEYEMCQFFFISALGKKISTQKGLSGNKLPHFAWNGKKDTERQKKGQFNLQMLFSKTSLWEFYSCQRHSLKKIKVITHAICQPLQQILRYVKHNDVFEMQLFQNPQDSAFRAGQKVLFMPLNS